MDITAIIQARMTSTRLPGKVLRRVLDKPLLAYMLERAARSRLVSRVVVATTVNAADDPVADLAQALGAPVHRGSEHDVLERFEQAAARFEAPVIMRLTADCPLIDWELMDALAAYFEAGGYDYACNSLEPTLPDGLDVELFTREALRDAALNATLPSQREHVSPYIRQCGRYRLGAWKSERDLSHLRWTVDEPEDFEVVRRIIEALYPANPAFLTRDILALIEREPELAEMNRRFIRNAGSLKSREADKAFQARQGRQGA